MEDCIICHLQDTRIRRQGLSLSGGDPLHPANLVPIHRLLQRVRRECPGKDVWMWTGYTLGTLTEVQQQLVALVDGKFVQDLHDPAPIWRGSGNQVIHDLNAQRRLQGATLRASPNAANITEAMGAGDAREAAIPTTSAAGIGEVISAAPAAYTPPCRRCSLTPHAEIAPVRCGAPSRHSAGE